ncbi:MAG TPA: class I SAM-dependent methyltransferase [Actinomycetes bacterium]|nr:class I SAM-dependent methyltransferase [Actinomycetes bacterium]
MGRPGTAASGFDAWARTYEHSALQSTLFIPAQEGALRLAQRLMARPRRVLDVGCGTGRLLRQARQRYPLAELVGVDVAWGMLAAATAATRVELAVRFVRAPVERLPFPPRVFDLVFATMSVRHWTDAPAGIDQIGRVLAPGGVFVLADVFPARRRRRRRHAELPAELAAALGAGGLRVVSLDRASWFRLPDIQVVAASRPPAATGAPWRRPPRRRPSAAGAAGRAGTGRWSR